MHFRAKSLVTAGSLPNFNGMESGDNKTINANIIHFFLDDIHYFEPNPHAQGKKSPTARSKAADKACFPEKLVAESGSVRGNSFTGFGKEPTLKHKGIIPE